MSTEQPDIRLSVLLADGGLALALGLAVLYLWAVMANPFFELFGLFGVVLVSGGVFLLAAVVDFVAAWKTAVRMLRARIFYLLAAAALTLIAALILFAWVDVVLVMKTPVVAHGMIFGTATLMAALLSAASFFERTVEYLTGAASMVVAALVAGLAPGMSERAFVGWMGAYLCIVGVKLLLINGNLIYRRMHAAIPASASTVLSARAGQTDREARQ